MPLSGYTVLTIHNELTFNVDFYGLTADQKLQMVNSAQQEVANMYNSAGKSNYQRKVVHAGDDCTVSVAAGTYGKVSYPTTAPTLKIKEILSVQVSDTIAPTVSDVFETQESINDLIGYCKSATAPDIAFALDGGTPHFFISTASGYSFSSDYEFYLKVLSDPTPVTATSDMVDIPNEAKELLKLIILRNLAVDKGQQPLRMYLNEIEEEKESLLLI